MRLPPSLLLLVLLPLSAQAQLIPIRTVPVATGDQFMIFPSRSLAMGGVSIAVDDPLYDPFVNPAKGARMPSVQVASTPRLGRLAMRGEADDASTRTLPVGVFARRHDVFGGAMLALQELLVPVQDLGGDGQATTTLANTYGVALAGLTLPGTSLSIGLNAFWADLNGLEGVRMLYWNGGQVEQEGTMSRYSLGVSHRATSGVATELVVVHHRFYMEHTRPGVSPRTGFTVPVGEGPAIRTELDETRGWAVVAGITLPVTERVHVGGRVVGDWQHHPKIPNYDLMQIPRDPGNSQAYNIGLGLGLHRGPTTWGLDLVYEPIWSHTWADAARPLTTRTGGQIQPGEMTVENHFRFHNTAVRMGIGNQFSEVFDLSFGLNVHTTRYDLDQENYVEVVTRDQDEQFSIWTLSTGFGLSFNAFQVRYVGCLTLGSGQPGVVQRGNVWMEGDAALFARSANFIVAPTGSLTLDEARVFSHQVSILVPLVE